MASSEQRIKTKEAVAVRFKRERDELLGIVEDLIRWSEDTASPMHVSVLELASIGSRARAAVKSIREGRNVQG